MDTRIPTITISATSTFIISVLFLACQSSSEQGIYAKNVGDITFDELVDDPTFLLCDANHVAQYYNFSKGMQYKGEKIRILEHFETLFKGNEIQGETGYITIRFIVNCHGKSGRFRLQGMNENYEEKKFHHELATRIMDYTKKLDGWVEEKNDYYQYLTFRIQNGRITDIMP